MLLGRCASLACGARIAQGSTYGIKDSKIDIVCLSSFRVLPCRENSMALTKYTDQLLSVF